MSKVDLNCSLGFINGSHVLNHDKGQKRGQYNENIWLQVLYKDYKDYKDYKV